MTVAAAGSVLAASAGYAQATGAAAEGGAAHSPGVLSGNVVQVPVNAPVNLCGNGVNVLSALSVTETTCANGSGGSTAGGTHGSEGTDTGGSAASGTAQGSPGVASGNVIQVPVNAPVNVCGNNVTGVGVAHLASTNCTNHGGGASTTQPGDNEPGGNQPGGNQPGGNQPSTPDRPTTPHVPDGPEQPGAQKPGKESHTPSHSRHDDAAQPIAHRMDMGHLAETGSEGLELLIPASAGMLLAGAVLYRRARAAQH